jgi:hypothetical protein
MRSADPELRDQRDVVIQRIRRTIIGLAALLVAAALAWFWLRNRRFVSEIPSSFWSVYRSNREDIAPLLTPMAAAVAAAIALMQVRIARERHYAQTDADRQRRITESFSQAVEQLASEKVEVRLGGIYALERISRESADDYWTVMEMLSAFVRERTQQEYPDPIVDDSVARFSARVGEEEGGQQGRWGPPTDIAAVLTVIRRRDPISRARENNMGWRLNLWSADLQHAFLHNAHLDHAVLHGAHFERAYLEGAHLGHADLTEAHLENAYLVGAHLEGADIRSAHLEGAILASAHLDGANLQRADFKGAYLTDANLEGANLDSAVGLTTDQLAHSFGDAMTVLPVGIARPAHWPAISEQAGSREAIE